MPKKQISRKELKIKGDLGKSLSAAKKNVALDNSYDAAYNNYNAIFGQVPKKTLISTNNSNFVELDTKEKEDAYYRKLTEDLKSFDVDYLEYLDKSMKWDKNSKRFDLNLGENTRIYNSYLMTMALRPLLYGEKGSHGAYKAAGMGIGMLLTNKGMRQSAKAAVYQTVMPFAEKRAHGANRGMWAHIRDHCGAYLNGGRPPMDARMAAFLKVGMMRKAYDEMRQPGNDPEEVAQGLSEALNKLETHCEQDGVSKESVDKSVRHIIGAMAEKDYASTAFISEFYDNTVNQEHDPYKRQVLYEEGKGKEKGKLQAYDVWDGEFSRPNGEAYEGSFSVRLPQDTNAHFSKIYNSMSSNINSCKNSQELHEKVKNLIDMHDDMFNADSDKNLDPRDLSKREQLIKRNVTYAFDDLRNPHSVEGLYQRAMNKSIVEFARSNPKVYDDFLNNYNDVVIDLNNNGIDDREENIDLEKISNDYETRPLVKEDGRVNVNTVKNYEKSGADKRHKYRNDLVEIYEKNCKKKAILPKVFNEIHDDYTKLDDSEFEV